MTEIYMYVYMYTYTYIRETGQEILTSVSVFQNTNQK